MLYYKIDVMKRLKDKGYSTYRILKEHLIPQGTVTKINNGEVIGLITLDKICSLLQMQPGSIIGWKPDEPEADTKTE